MSTIAIVQARMGATRFPGKVLKPILGKPMLELQLKRMLLAKSLMKIVIATSTKSADTRIAKLAHKLHIPIFRGSEKDVLDRYVKTAIKFAADPIVRITGDCPLIDPAVIDRVVKVYRQGEYDYVSNVHARSFPRGMDVEVISFTALNTAWKRATRDYDREHVTPYIYSHPNKFKLKEIIAPFSLHRPNIRLTVDELPDFQLVQTICQRLGASCSLSEIISFLDQHPHLTSINAHIHQKATPHQVELK